MTGRDLELELIQTHMAQKPMLLVEVGAHAVRSVQHPVQELYRSGYATHD
jgi:hypothetical protein